MAEYASDSSFELNFNSDQTQVFASIHPPRGGGRMVTVEEIVQRMRTMGVVGGIRDGDIARAVALVQSSNTSVLRALVAQGTLPVDGVDAQMQWNLDHHAASHPVPRSAAGAPDYAAIAADRIVQAGQVLATVKPAMPGSPGKTLTGPFKSIPAAQARDVAITAGPGTAYSSDTHQFTAAVDGIVEIDGARLLVHAFQWLTEDMNNMTREFAGGVFIRGDVTASTIRAAGPIVVTGTVAGCVLRAKGDVVLTRCARSKILADGDVFVSGRLLHCQTITPKRVVGSDGSLFMGGSIIATMGVEAADVGGLDGVKTHLTAAADKFSYYRQQEVEAEIALHEENIQKIARALRPLSSVAQQENVPEQKRALVQTLVAERRNQEERVRELHHEKRGLILASKSRVDAEICIAGTIYRGVTVQIDGASSTIDGNKCSVRFGLDSFRDSIVMSPLHEAIAA